MIQGEMDHAVTLLFLLATLSFSLSADPSKPTWPNEFALPFGLHFTALVENSTATLYYNYDQVQSQLLDYDTHCFPLIRYDSVYFPCKMYFNPKGIFASIPALKIPCCLYVANVGAVPPTFLQGFTYSGHNDTVPDMDGVMHDTYRWDGAGDFKYWTDIKTGDDIQFQDGPTGVKWNFGDMQVEPQSPSLFALPSGNCSVACSFFDTSLFLEPENVHIPFVGL